MNREIFKKNKEELQEYLQFRGRGSKIPNKKGKGSYNRNRIKSEGENEQMTKEEFDQWLKEAWEQKEPNEPAPFCPFKFFGYCNVAYSENCWICEDGPQFIEGEE